MTNFDSRRLMQLVQVAMPFGKYKGHLIADLPGNYLNWFARKGFPPGELGSLLALMHEIDHNGLSGLLTPLRAARLADKSPHASRNTGTSPEQG